jgi:Domain of unknown function (DUF6378)
MKERLIPHRVIILETAIKLTDGERNASYGSPFINHSNIAALMNAYLDTRRSSLGPLAGAMPLDAEDAAMLMVMVKVARIAQRWGGQQTDSFADAAAYIGIASECRMERDFGDKAENVYKASDVARAT